MYMYVKCVCVCLYAYIDPQTTQRTKTSCRSHIHANIMELFQNTAPVRGQSLGWFSLGSQINANARTK